MCGKFLRVKRLDIIRETVFFEESQYVCAHEPPGTLTKSTRISHWKIQHGLGGTSKVLPFPDELRKIENFLVKGSQFSLEMDALRIYQHIQKLTQCEVERS